MTRTRSARKNEPRMKKRLLTALLAAVLSLCWTGCQSPKVIDPYSSIIRLPAGKPYTPPADGYFVPDARMRQILDRLSE